MSTLNIILSIALTLSLIFNYLKLIEQKTAFEIVNDMGIGYNLGNSFECYCSWMDIEKPDDQITLNDNPIPTKELILRLKKYGFKTIRLPITWTNFIDEKGNINSEWLYRIKEVLTWITDAKMYCIINVHYDIEYGQWLYYGLESKEIYINLWSQIAKEFKDYDEHLIFESMNEPQFYDEDYNFDYHTLLILTQAFIDTIRNSDNMNKQRLLIITGPYSYLDMISFEEFKLPIDPKNKFAISFQYYNPIDFTKGEFFDMWNDTDDSGYTTYFEPDLHWGTDNDYRELFTDFNLMKTQFLEKKIPVIITATGVLTEEQKEKESIREYLYAIFSLSSEYNGMMVCLWDSSKEVNYTESFSAYTMKFYNREEDKWFDDKLQNNFLQISKGKYIKLSEYYIKSNKEILIEPNFRDNYNLKIGNRKALKIILNARISGILYKDIDFAIGCYDNSGGIIEFEIGKKNIKKEYDGTTTFTIDISDQDCFISIRVDKYYGRNELIIFNNLTVEFEETFLYFDYQSYKNDLQKYLY